MPSTTTIANPLAYLAEQVQALRDSGSFNNIRELQSACEPISHVDGREVINLASNNYLGLANHPKLKEAAIKAVEKYGAGTGAVRTISGTMDLHNELEQRIAKFKNVEACVVFQSGFTANAGTVSAVLTPQDHILSDELNHASIIDGCRLSKAKIHVFKHADPASAEEKLKALDGVPGRKLLITDGVFSMDGDIAPLPELVELAEKYGAIMMVDDAHSSGVLGRQGRGTVDHYNLHGRVDIQVGTLSKAVGVLGGYVCGRRELIDYLQQRGRPFLFSTSHPPAVVAANLAAFDIFESEPERLQALWDNTSYYKAKLTAAGFQIGNTQTPITPILVGEAKTAHGFSKALFEAGLWATGIGFPTVPEGKARIRTIVTATHTREHLDRAVEILSRVARSMGILTAE